MKGFEICDMNEHEFYGIIMQMNSKIDTLLERSVSKDDCYKSKAECYKSNIEPIKAFQYKFAGAMLAINIIAVYAIKKWG